MGVGVSVGGGVFGVEGAVFGGRGRETERKRREFVGLSCFLDINGQ